MQTQIPFNTPLGTLVGSGSEFGTLRAVVAFQEEKRIPPLGAFLILEWGAPKQTLVVRLEKVDYTDYHTSAARREESLVVAYLQRIGRYGPGELTEEEKKALFFKELLLRVLGRLDPITGKFEAGLRHLPPLTATLRYPTEQELHLLLSLGGQEDRDQNAPPPQLAQIGHFVLGTYEYPDFPVRFSPDRFEQRRTAVFAQTGYGKSNLTKVLVSLAAWTSSSGILIFDLDGEYALGDPRKEVYGLADIPALRPRISVFSRSADRLRQMAPDLDIHPLMDLGELYPNQIQHLMQIMEPGKSTIFTFGSKWKQIESLFRGWLATLTQVQDNEQNEDLREQQEQTFRELVNQMVSNQDHQGPLQRALSTLGFLHQPTGENFILAIRRALEQGRVVIVDLSGWPIHVASALAEVLASHILNRNLKAMTDPQKRLISVIAVVEEAQNVLNKQALERGGAFVRWAKEGRKLGLGLIYITQQPGAIAEEIVSQTDNFFVMHLMAQTDTHSLSRANTKFAGVIEQFILGEPIKGNAYVYSAPYQPFVFPTRILHFTPENIAHVLGLEDFDWIGLIDHLSNKSLGGRDTNSIVGHLSYAAYAFLQRQANKAKDQGKPFLWPHWVDHSKKRLAFEQARRILAYLVLGKGSITLHPDIQKNIQTEALWFTPDSTEMAVTSSPEGEEEPLPPSALPEDEDLPF